MRTILATLALLAGLAAGPSAFAQTSPCQGSSTGTVNGIPCQRLPGLFYAPAPGTGVEAEAIVATGTADDTTFLRGDGAWETPSEDGNSFATDVDLSLTGQNLSIDITGNTGFTGLTDTVQFPEETHVDSGTISGTPPVLNLHLTDGTNVPITGLPEGTTEWTGLTDTPSSIVADNCVKGNVAGDALSFGSCGSGGGGGTADGRVTAFTATASGPTVTFTVEQNEGLSDIDETLTLTDANIPNLPASKITTGAFGTSQIADDAVTQAKLANNSVHAPQIGANAVGTSEISANAVGTSELAADAVTNANLADDSVHNDQLASNSVRADEIQANAVGHVEMNDDSVGVGELITSNTPATSQVLSYDGSGMLWVAQTGGGGGGASTFTALSDTPGTITAERVRAGQRSGRCARVRGLRGGRRWRHRRPDSRRGSGHDDRLHRQPELDRHRRPDRARHHRRIHPRGRRRDPGHGRAANRVRDLRGHRQHHLYRDDPDARGHHSGCRGVRRPGPPRC